MRNMHEELKIAKDPHTHIYTFIIIYIYMDDKMKYNITIYI